jgi:hypothetical protein
MLAELKFPTKTSSGASSECGVGIIIGTGMVALYIRHEFTCGFSPDLARSVARRMLEMADLLDPQKAASCVEETGGPSSEVGP